jgi:hypothetical protein
VLLAFRDAGLACGPERENFFGAENFRTRRRRQSRENSFIVTTTKAGAMGLIGFSP